MITYLILFKAMLVERGMAKLSPAPQRDYVTPDPFGERSPSPDVAAFFKASRRALPVLPDDTSL